MCAYYVEFCEFTMCKYVNHPHIQKSTKLLFHHLFQCKHFIAQFGG